LASGLLFDLQGEPPIDLLSSF